MTTYNLAKRIIDSGNYDTADMVKKLDAFLLADRISVEQYSELVNVMGVQQNT